MSDEEKEKKGREKEKERERDRLVCDVLFGLNAAIKGRERDTSAKAWTCSAPAKLASKRVREVEKMRERQMRD